MIPIYKAGVHKSPNLAQIVLPGPDFGLQRGPVREPERGGLVARRSRLRGRPRGRRRTLQRGTQEDPPTGTTFGNWV